MKSIYIYANYWVQLKKKALIYIIAKESLDKPNELSSEYKNCYNYWQVRQDIMTEINIHLFSNLSKNNLKFYNTYLRLFSLNRECLLREILEDFLYVTLNILLAKSILDNKELSKYLDNNKLYYQELGNIYQKHFIAYKAEYHYLYQIREYGIYNFLSLDDLKKNYKWKSYIVYSLYVFFV